MNVNLSSGESCKLFMYDRVKLSSKSECGAMAPLFSPIDFKHADRLEDDDTWGHKFVEALQEKGEALDKMVVDDICVVLGNNKSTKEQWLEHEAKHTDCVYEIMKNLSPVMAMPDKESVSEAIVPILRTFKWNDALKGAYPGAEFTEGSLVRCVSYEQIKVKEGKAIWISPHCDPATCIKSSGGKSGAN